jgi:hypothetical protein
MKIKQAAKCPKCGDACKDTGKRGPPFCDDVIEDGWAYKNYIVPIIFKCYEHGEFFYFLEEVMWCTGTESR